MTDPARLAVTLTLAELRELVAAAVAAALETLAAPPPAEVLDRTAAAQLLGVSLPTLRALVVSGAVPERRLGDAPRYLRSELLAACKPAGAAGELRLPGSKKPGGSGCRRGRSVRGVLSGEPKCTELLNTDAE